MAHRRRQFVRHGIHANSMKNREQKRWFRPAWAMNMVAGETLGRGKILLSRSGRNYPRCRSRHKLLWATALYLYHNNKNKKIYPLAIKHLRIVAPPSRVIVGCCHTHFVYYNIIFRICECVFYRGLS
jgi:hypothetical protein